MSFLFLLMYLFVTFIRPQDWLEAVRGWPLVNGLALATAYAMLCERFITKKPAFVKVPQNVFMLGLFASALMSHVAHTYLGGLIFTAKGFLIILILFFLILNVMNTERKVKTGIWFIVALILILVFQGMHQIETGRGWAGQLPTVGYTPEDVRINWVGIFNDPNDLALIFVVASGITLAFLFGGANFFIKTLSVPMIGLLFYGIYLTNSRGGILALIAAFGFYFIRKTRHFILGGILGVGAAAAIFALGPSRLGLITMTEASAYTRIELWYQGLAMLKSNPLFGVGYDMFMNDLPQTAHNSYILVGAELGLVGLFFWMGLIYVSIKQMTVIQNKEPRLADYAYGLQAALVGFCSAAFFLSRSYVIVPYMLFALAGSLFYAARRQNPELDFQLVKRDYVLILMMSVGVLSFAYLIFKVGV